MLLTFCSATKVLSTEPHRYRLHLLGSGSMQRGVGLQQEVRGSLPELGGQGRRSPEEGHDLQGEHAKNGEADAAVAVLQVGFSGSPKSKTHPESSSSGQVAQCLQNHCPLSLLWASVIHRNMFSGPNFSFYHEKDRLSLLHLRSKSRNLKPTTGASNPRAGATWCSQRKAAQAINR